MSAQLQGNVTITKWEDVAKRPEYLALSATEKVAASEQYFQEVVAPQLPQEEQGPAWGQFYNQAVMPTIVPPQQPNPALDFLGQVANTAIQTGSFGIIDRPEPTNELAGLLGGLVGGAIPVGGATLFGGFPAGIAAAAALGGGTSIRDQYDEGKTDINIPRVLASTLAGGLGQFAGGKFGTTLLKDALINAGFNAGEVASIQALEGAPTDMGQILKAAGVGVGATVGGRGASALLSRRRKAQAPSQPAQEQPKSMLEQAEPPQQQAYSPDGMSDRALKRVASSAKVGTTDDVVKVAKSERAKLFESLLRLEAQNRQDSPEYTARRKALEALDGFIKNPSKKGYAIDYTPKGRPPAGYYIEPSKPVPAKPTPPLDLEALIAKEKLEVSKLKPPQKAARRKGRPPAGYYIEPSKPVPAKPASPLDLEALRAKERLEVSKLKPPQEAVRRAAQLEQAKQVQATLLKKPIGQLPGGKPTLALPSFTPRELAKVQARLKQSGTVLPPSQEVIPAKGRRRIPRPTQGNVPRLLTGKSAEQARAKARERAKATEEAQAFATVIKKADAVPDDKARLRAYKKLRTQAENKLIDDPTNALAKQRIETIQGRIDAMAETAANKQAAQNQLAQKAKIKPATVDDTTAKAKEPAKITPKEAGQLLTELYSGDHVGVVDNQTAYEVFEALGVPVKKVHRDNITSADVTRFGNQVVFNVNLGPQLGMQRIGENETLGGVISRLQKQYPNINVASALGGRVVRNPNVFADIIKDVEAVQKAGGGLPDNLVSALERGGLTEQAKRDAEIAAPYEKLDKLKNASFQNMDRAQTFEALNAAFKDFVNQWSALDGDFKALKNERALLEVFEQAEERFSANENILKEAKALGVKPAEPVEKPAETPAKVEEPEPTLNEQLPTEESLVGATSASTRKKLEKAKEVLARKEEELNRRFDNRFEHTRKTNGQPMNDKRNGQTWFNQADRLDQAIRNQIKEIEKSKAYIERLESRAIFLEQWEKKLPAPLLEAALDGRLNQWKKHPRMFFVKGVEKARIVWNPDTKTIGATYVKEIPNKEQYAIFRDTFNGLRKELGLSNATPTETPKAKFIPQATDEGRLGTRYTTPNPNMTVRKQKNGNWVVETKQPDGKYGKGVRVADEATAKLYVANADVLAKTVEVKAKIKDPVNPAKIHANASKLDQILPLVPDDKKPFVKAFGKAMADGKLIDVETFAEKFGLTVGDDPKDRLDYPYDVDVNPKTGDILLKGIRQTDGQPRSRLLKEGQLGFVERNRVMQIPKETEVKSEITSIKPSDKEVMYRPSYEPDAEGKPQLVVRDRDGNIVEQVEAKSVPVSSWLAKKLLDQEEFSTLELGRAGRELLTYPDRAQIQDVIAKFPKDQQEALRKLLTGMRCMP